MAARVGGVTLPYPGQFFVHINGAVDKWAVIQKPRAGYPCKWSPDKEHIFVYIGLANRKRAQAPTRLKSYQGLRKIIQIRGAEIHPCHNTNPGGLECFSFWKFALVYTQHVRCGLA